MLSSTTYATVKMHPNLKEIIERVGLYHACPTPCWRWALGKGLTGAGAEEKDHVREDKSETPSWKNQGINSSPLAAEMVGVQSFKGL